MDKLIIEKIEDYDRYIKYELLNGEVVSIDFLQGTSPEVYEDLVNRNKKGKKIMKIYNTINDYHKLIDTNKDGSLEISKHITLSDKINHAIELYIDKYIIKFL